MKRVLLFFGFLILVQLLDAQFSSVTSDFLLPFQSTRIKTAKIALKKNKNSQCNLNFVNYSKQKYGKCDLIIWDKEGNYHSFPNVFNNSIDFFIHDSIFTKWNDKYFKLSLIQDSIIIWQRNKVNSADFILEKEKEVVKEIEKKINPTVVNINVHDNLKSNKELGKINNKIELGESIIFKYLINSENGINGFKVWISVNQAGFRYNPDTIIKSGKRIVDSIKLNCPFAYPKYEKSFIVTLYFQNQITKVVDSVSNKIWYDRLISENLGIPFELECNVEIKENSVAVLVVDSSQFYLNEVDIITHNTSLINNNIVDLDLVGDYQNQVYSTFIQTRVKLNLEKYKYDFQLSIKSQSDSLVLIKKFLNGKNTSYDSTFIFNLNKALKLLNKPYYFDFQYSRINNFKTKISLGFVLIPFEFTNSTNSSKLPYGYSLRIARKNGISFFWLSNFANWNPNYVLEGLNSKIPDINFLKYIYTPTPNYEYSLSEFGVMRDFYINNRIFLSLGARYTTFKYASIIDVVDCITGKVTQKSVQLNNESYTSIDPCLGFSCKLFSKFNLGIQYGTRKLKINQGNINLNIGYTF